MEIAILTDIHGNAPALKAVFKDIELKGTIDHIYCLGDMIAIGPDTNEVLEILFTRTDVSMITGNHDEAVLALITDKEYPQSHLHVYPHHDWIAERLHPDFIPKLEALPRTIRKKINNKSFLFTHYHIDKAKMNKPISEDPFATIQDPSLENLEKLFNQDEEDVICFGHHHPVHYFSNAQTIFLNPGSLGCYDKPFARYGTININENMEINLHEVGYDNKEFLNSYENLRVTERDFILEVFHGNQHLDY